MNRTPPAPLLLKNLTSEHLHQELAEDGVSLQQARRVLAASIRQGDYPPVGPGMPARTAERIRVRTRIPHLRLIRRAVSPTDGFAKYVFQGEGAEPFEAVRIPLLHRKEDPKYVVCVSSQVGCALGCAFCATGRMGLHRNLAPWEMVDPVVQIAADSPHPVRGVVFMGMGEPLLNYDSVIEAARILSEPCGMAISGKAITLCTAGIVPGIRRFTAEKHPFRLIVSLTSADPTQRRELMPVEATHSTEDLMQAIREYQAATRQRVTLAWVVISGVNTREADARALARLVGTLPARLDLIDVQDPSGRYQPPSPEELGAFRDALRRHLGIPVARRYSGGKDIGAACGMLAPPIA
jgi:23S rRNA (adenine2503-C2)-methyltransferase